LLAKIQQGSDMASKFRSQIPWREAGASAGSQGCADSAARAGAIGKGTMVIPKPLDVDALIRNVPKGKLVTVTQLREQLAKQCKADVACPLTTGIFVRIAAEAAEEKRRAGKKEVTPYWRVLTQDVKLNPKFPGGVQAQKRRLLAEGHKFNQPKSSRPPAVKDFEKQLVAYLEDADIDDPDLFFNLR